MFDRYRVSSCHHREKKTSSQRHSRATGPAPSCAPCSNADRNIAKLSEMRVTPMSSACRHSSLTINSMVPLGDCGERRITSSEAPLLPHGTNESMATTVPSTESLRSCPPISPRTASTSRQSPSAGSPRRPSAIENPRSVSVSRQASAWAITSAICSLDSSRCLRIRTVTPARRARVTAWRTARMSGPESRKESGCRIASSPSWIALSPAARKASAPPTLAPMTPGAHPYVSHNASHAPIAWGQAFGSPTGSPLARQTPTSTR